jgi:hypothetical protein
MTDAKQPFTIILSPEDFQKGYFVADSDFAAELRNRSIHNFDRMATGTSSFTRCFFNGKSGTTISYICKKLGPVMKEYQIQLPANISPSDGDMLAFQVVENTLNISQTKQSLPQVIDETPSFTSSDKYPDKLVDWAGSAKGGVRLVFSEQNGRPVQSQIRTNLVIKAEGVAQDILTNIATPRLIMFAGGAGNGKTDTLEVLLAGICSPELLNEFKDEVRRRIVASGRKVIFKPSSDDARFFPTSVQRYARIAFVQDASESYDKAESASVMLAKDLESIQSNSVNELLILCVNRGVLYSAANEIKDRRLIDLILRAIDPINVDMASWPVEPVDGLVRADEFYLWPLDIDSICESFTNDESAVQQVLKDLDLRDWSTIQDFAPEHPLVHSRRLLSLPEFRKAFSKLLREYELISGKNINFRKLFSMTSYLFTGGLTPAEDKLPSVFSGPDIVPPLGDDLSELDLAFRVYRHSLPYLLFPSLPGCERLADHLNKLNIQDPNHALNILSAFIKKQIEFSKKRSGFPGAEIFTNSNSDWASLIDPARGSSVGENPIFSDLESDLCLGLDCLAAKYNHYLDPSSRALLCRIVLISEELGSFAADKQNSDADCKWIALWIGRWASVIVKRSIFVYLLSKGEVRTGNTEQVNAFHNANKNADEDAVDYADRAKQFLLGPMTSSGEWVNEEVVVHLAKGLCQPYSDGVGGASLGISNLDLDVELLAEKRELRPRGSLLVLEFKSGDISVRLPVSMSMHDFMNRKDRGELFGSMPAALRGVVDTFRLQLDGFSMRSKVAKFTLYCNHRKTDFFRLSNLVIKSGSK